MSGVSRGLDRVVVAFDDSTLVANAGLLLVATLASRLGIEALVNLTLRLSGRVGALNCARPSRHLGRAACPQPPGSRS